ncbi:superinfection exclusion B family protein [Tumidithrix elongata RA019]|uniref:Superinfection exclusion B family protein n=1 Tax=Tumidithrix elongata BACA0141 TaxID=2716417 RepID=A0AAW9Q4F0_9CYAN|nr:superinfection exclusion B family protein [Tumidithrix elongata RA019]
MSNIEKILPSVLQASPYVILGITIASGISLFAPISILESLGIVDLLANNRSWIGGTFLLSISILLSMIIVNGIKLITPALIKNWNVRQYRKELSVLSPPEKQILVEYIRKNTTTLPQRMQDGVVGGLVAKNILYWASNIGHPGSTMFDCNIQPWVWERLHRRPELVDLVKE